MLRAIVTGLSISLLLGANGALAQSAKKKPSVPTEMREEIQNSYIVSFNENASRSDVRRQAYETAEKTNGKVKFVYGSVVNGFSITLPAGAAAQLAGLPNVARVEKDQLVYALHHRDGHDAGGGDTGGGGGNPNKGKKTTDEPAPAEPPASFDCPVPSGAGAMDWGVARAGANGVGGIGVDVFIIDTGIDRDHPDLCGNISTVATSHFAATSCVGSQCLTAWDDDNGHGSHVAGTVAAKGGLLGMAPDATLHAVKVLTNYGSGSYSGVIAGIDFVAQQAAALGKPVVANMSLGGSYSATLNEAITAAKAAGVLFAVAAGNEGADAQTKSPASSPDAITVSATASDCSWASWSNWGDGDASGPAPEPVDVAAPGVSIKSTWFDGGYKTISGTSMASPHVAGALALWLSGAPEDSNGNGTLFDEAIAAVKGSAVYNDDSCTYEITARHKEGFLQFKSD